MLENVSPLILVVDDSWVSRQLIIKMIKESSYTNIIEAENGAVALEKIRNQKPSVVFLDLLMPVMSGDEMMKNLKNDSFFPKIIVISADIQETTRQRCKELGACDFLNKPVHSAAISEVLKKCL